jgi:hypothetical protein
VRERLTAMGPNRRLGCRGQHQRGQFVPPMSAPSGGFSQKRSDR